MQAVNEVMPAGYRFAVCLRPPNDEPPYVITNLEQKDAKRLCGRSYQQLKTGSISHILFSNAVKFQEQKQQRKFDLV